MFYRIIIVCFVALAAAGVAWATPVGEEYWLDTGVFPVVAAQMQLKADAAGKALDSFLGAGIGVGHADGVAWQALIEGGGLPVAKTGQVRAEARLGYWRITVGPTYGATIAPRLLNTIGPAVSLDWPFIWGKSPREGRDNVLSVFYRLDAPIGVNAKGMQIRHQIGVRFLFDLPEFAGVWTHSQPQWLNPVLSH